MVLVVYLARWLEKSGARVRGFREGLLPFLVMFGLVVGLVLLEKDLGTAMVMAVIALAMFLVAGARWWHVEQQHRRGNCGLVAPRHLLR